MLKDDIADDSCWNMELTEHTKVRENLSSFRIFEKQLDSLAGKVTTGQGANNSSMLMA